MALCLKLCTTFIISALYPGMSLNGCKDWIYLTLLRIIEKTCLMAFYLHKLFQDTNLEKYQCMLFKILKIKEKKIITGVNSIFFLASKV